MPWIFICMGSSDLEGFRHWLPGTLLASSYPDVVLWLHSQPTCQAWSDCRVVLVLASPPLWDCLSHLLLHRCNFRNWTKSLIVPCFITVLLIRRIPPDRNLMPGNLHCHVGNAALSESLGHLYTSWSHRYCWHRSQHHHKVDWLGLLNHFNSDTVHNYLSFVLLNWGIKCWDGAVSFSMVDIALFPLVLLTSLCVFILRWRRHMLHGRHCAVFLWTFDIPQIWCCWYSMWEMPLVFSQHWYLS